MKTVLSAGCGLSKQPLLPWSLQMNTIYHDLNKMFFDTINDNIIIQITHMKNLILLLLFMQITKLQFKMPLPGISTE